MVLSSTDGDKQSHQKKKRTRGRWGDLSHTNLFGLFSSNVRYLMNTIISELGHQEGLGRRDSPKKWLRARKSGIEMYQMA